MGRKRKYKVSRVIFFFLESLKNKRGMRDRMRKARFGEIVLPYVTGEAGHDFFSLHEFPTNLMGKLVGNSYSLATSCERSIRDLLAY